MWSLAIEEQFYLVWPLVVSRVSPHRLTRLCLWIIGIVVTVGYVTVHFPLPTPGFVYVLKPLRCDTLLFGGLIALLEERHMLRRVHYWIKWVAVAGCAALGMGIHRAHGTSSGAPGMERFVYLGLDLLFACLIASVVIWRGSFWLAPARSRFLGFFGKYRYAIYVFNYPLAISLSSAINIPIRAIT
jgi:peptidoglycan/LPS O-acetylase OafA/YrhL